MNSSNDYQDFAIEIKQSRAKVRSVHPFAMLEVVPDTRPQQYVVKTAGGIMPPKNVDSEPIANGITPIYAWKNAAQRI